MSGIGSIQGPSWIVPYSRAVLKTTGLVSVWPFDETGTLARDAFGASPATIAGTATRSSLNPLLAEASSSIKLDGTTAYASTPHITALNLLDTVSVEVLLRYGVNAAERMIVCKGAGAYGVKITTSGKPRLSRYGIGDGKYAANALNDNLWHHVLITHAPGVDFVYVDGVDVSTGTALASAFVNTATALFIGSFDTGPTLPYDGNMAWLALYNVALAPGIAAAHNAARLG